MTAILWPAAFKALWNQGIRGLNRPGPDGKFSAEGLSSEMIG